MRNSIDNISDMLGSTRHGGSSNVFNSIDLSQYSLIKSGKYAKLMKAYYAKPDKVSSPETSNTKKETTTVDKTGITRMKAEADSLKNTADKLISSDMWNTGAQDYSEENIRKAVGNFVKDYNKVMEQSSKVSTKNSVIDNNAGWMNRMTGTISKQLSKIGISQSADGTLAIDDDSFAKADIKDIKNLFSGNNSYAGQIKNYAANIAGAATTATLYNNQASVYNTFQSILDVGI